MSVLVLRGKGEEHHNPIFIGNRTNFDQLRELLRAIGVFFFGEAMILDLLVGHCTELLLEDLLLLIKR